MPNPVNLLSHASYSEFRRINDILRKETVGGALLVVATVAALIWANSAAGDSYFALRDFTFGFEPLHLKLSVGEWAADGLLAVFFFLAGLELKKEFVIGDLRSVSRAVVPIAAAFGGVVVPAVIFVLVNLQSGPETLRGWAIPTATDIAFAVAVLAVISSHLPSALRLFLLTLAVVDDLIAIVIIAFFYSTNVAFVPLLLAIVPLAVFAFITHRFSRFFSTRPAAAWFILLPLGIIVWGLVHASGIHATVAGVLLGFAVPVQRRAVRLGIDKPEDEGKPGLAEHLEHRFRPISAGVAVPLFAFFSAGVALGGFDGLRSALTDPVAVGIVAALVLGKPIGVMAATLLTTSVTRARLDPSLAWIDVVGMAMLAGIGFTVSLLINDLSFGAGSPHDNHAKVAILVGSLLSALLATGLLRIRDRHYKRITAEENVDANSDGIPDVYQQDD